MRVQPSGYRHEVTASHVLVIMHALVSLPRTHMRTRARAKKIPSDELARAPKSERRSDTARAAKRIT